MKLADVDQIYETFKELRKDDVKALQEWVVKQPQLPSLTELDLVLFLHSCYCSIEMAKTTIDNFYTYRTYCPQFFSNWNPLDTTFKKSMDSFLFTELPKTSEGYKVVFCKLLTADATDYVFTEWIKVFDMGLMQWLYTEGPAEGLVMVVDMINLRMAHLTKSPLFEMKKFFMYLQEALPVRLKGIHYLNVSSVVDVLMGMIKPFIKKEVADLLHFHGNSSEKVFEFVPKELFPSDFGGKSESLEQLRKNMIRLYTENKAFLEKCEQFVADDSKRLMKRESVINVFGSEGSFKKLEVD